MPTRIALTGKGGVGKTSIAGTLARLLARAGHRVIAVDGDLNPNLGITLGLSAEDAAFLEPIPKDAVELRTLDGGERQLLLTRTPEEFLNDVATGTPDGVSLVLMGRPDHAGHGWMCGEHAAVRGILESLPGDDAISIIDMGASPEPFSRGTLTPVDRLVLVVEPYFKALEAAGRMAGLAAQLEIPEVGMVANKVRRPEHRDAIEAYSEEKGIPLWGVVPFDEAFVDADLQGTSILDHAPDGSPALEQLGRLASSFAGERWSA